MDNLQLTSQEQALANYDFAALQSKVEAAAPKIAAATSVNDIKTEVCKIWSDIKPFVGILEKIPLVGKFITALATVLDAICD